jgi:hypothetical protein
MRRRRLIAGDQGVATVMVAFMLLVVGVPFCIFAVDVANWFVHKRHLQNQADAAALAAGGVFRFPSCDNAVITNTALRYSGIGDAVAKYNATDPTVKGGRLHAQVNKPSYFGQTKPNETDLTSADSTPCTKGFVDVKMTETNLPYFFSSGLVPNINAQARVQLFKTTQGTGLTPLAAQDPTPKKVRVYIVDEATGLPVKDSAGNDVSALLSAHGSSGGVAHFDNESAPLSFKPPTPTGTATSIDLGVRVALSGSTSTTCPTTDTLNVCYDTSNLTQGLSYIRDWIDDGTALTANQKPRTKSISLSPGTCGNGSFTSSATNCAMGVSAQVRWNPDITAATEGTKAKLTATFNGSSYPMTFSGGTWTASSVTVPAGTIGPRTVTIDWEQQTGSVVIGTKVENCNAGSNNKCKGTFAGVQRSFWNNPSDQTSRGGPIAQLDVLNGSTLQQISDLRACSTGFTACTTNLVFELGVAGSLALAQPSDPPIPLRVQNNGGGQTQAVDCDPTRDVVTSFILGCGPTYQVNDGTPCTTPTTPYVSCLPTEQGNFSNKPAKGFNTRFLCNPPGNPGNCGGTAGNYDGKPSTCPPAGALGHNNWPNYPPDDPRLIGVYVTPFGTFQGSGSGLYPIVKFAEFYVTAYASNGQGFDNPCIGNGDQFAPGTSTDIGVVSGHYVKPISTGGGGATDQTCDFNDVDGCVAVLVK